MFLLFSRTVYNTTKCHKYFLTSKTCQILFCVMLCLQLLTFPALSCLDTSAFYMDYERYVIYSSIAGA